jgi:uncharacterized protein YjbJ (UPF0337 family)
MDSDRIIGTTKNVAGKVEGAIGRAAGDRKTEASGAAREAEGLIQDAYGQVKDGVSNIASQAADAGKAVYEGAGRVVSNNMSERPASALLVSGLIGLAIGYVLAKGSQPPRRRGYFDRYY